MENFYTLSIRELTKYTAGERWAFYALLLYLIVEYMRPQTMYPALDIIPWGKTVIALAILGSIAEGSLLRGSHAISKYFLVFVLVVIFSSFGAIYPKLSFSQLPTVMVLAAVYIIIVSIVNTEKRYFVFTILFILLTLKLSQAVTFSWIGRGFQYDRFGATAGSGWLENSGELVIQIVIVLALLLNMTLALRNSLSRFKLLILYSANVLLGLSVIACGSRGGFLALASLILVMWLKGKKKLWGVVLVIISATLFIALLPERDFERTISMGNAQDGTAQNRIQRWKNGWVLTKENPVLGVGFENWSVAVRNRFNDYGGEVHNIYIECSAELGFSGLLIFGVLIISCYRTNNRTSELAQKTGNIYIARMAMGQNVAMISYLVAGTFVTVLYYPYFWINLAMTVALHKIAINNLDSFENEKVSITRE